MSPPRRPAASDPAWLRWGLTLLAVTLALVIFILPLAAVLAEALRRGWAPALAAIVEPDTVAAIRLTLLVAVIAVPVNTIGGIAAA